MSTDADENSNNNVLNNLEQKLRQLNFECESKAFTVKTVENNLNDCLKHNILLEHELQQEHFDKSKIKIELAALITHMNKYNDRSNNSLDIDVNVPNHDYEYLSNKICEIQLENIELTQELTKSNDQLFQLMKSQDKYSEKIDSMTSLLNFLKQQIKKLDKESHVLVKILCINKTLAKKVLKAFEYKEKLNKTQFDQIQHLIKELANIKSQIHKFVNENEKNEIIKIDQENAIASAQIQLDIYKKLIEIFEVENNTLHKTLNKILEEFALDKFKVYY